MAEGQGVRFEVHTIVERENSQGGERKSFWIRVGSAFTNKDGSINVFLDALPVNGRLQLRVPQERIDEPQGQRKPAPQQRQGGGGKQW